MDKRPRCDNCSGEALMIINGLNLCGDCIIKLDNRKKEQMIEALKD